MSLTPRAAQCLVAIGLAALLPSVAPAQARVTTLVGSVRDSAGRAIADAELRIDDSAVLARTGAGGGFHIARAPVGTVRVAARRLGFAPTTLAITLLPGRTDSLVVTLLAVAAELPGVVVEEDATTRSQRLLPGFWERRARGFGSFITRDEIVRRNTSEFVDLLRRLPGASITQVNGRPAVRFKRNIGPRDCPPQYFVDGMPLHAATPDEFSPEDVEAIELYAGPATTPVQFAPRPMSNTCGAIVIWTRLPG